jgi:Mg-chelatase subunit ChlD
MLRRRLPDLERELTHGVLTGRDGDGPHPLDRRTAACEVLAASPTGTATLALLTATRPAHPEPEVPPELLDEAASALSGRESEGVHLRLIHLFERCESEPGLMHKSILENHFRSIQLGRDEGRAIQAVLGLVGPSVRSADWRRASRGISVSRCLPNGPALPLLIEALEDWLAREDDPDRPVRRVQGELVAELERRSSRRYGRHPDRWRALLEAWQRGGTALAGEPGQPVPSTVGGFFGLRPSTDRVTFVLDCSGSMEARFRSAGGRTRLEEAAEQMRALVEQLGPRTRFNVVVFADEARRWRETLARADEAALRAATRFVLRTGAGGGTRLQEGIRVALHADRTGHLDLRALESDTVIVLCDGGTAEGPGWVEPFLREVNDEARVVFHAVQLGQGGDGTLEALSEGSRGELLRIDG